MTTYYITHILTKKSSDKRHTSQAKNLQHKKEFKHLQHHITQLTWMQSILRNYYVVTPVKKSDILTDILKRRSRKCPLSSQLIYKLSVHTHRHNKPHLWQWNAWTMKKTDIKSFVLSNRHSGLKNFIFILYIASNSELEKKLKNKMTNVGIEPRMYTD